MRRFISLFLALLMLLSTLLVAVSCAGNDDAPSGDEPGTGGQHPQGGKPSEDSGIVVPPLKDYGRGTVDFDKLTYSRPDIAAGIAAFEAATRSIEENELSFDEQLELILALEEPYSEILTMNAIARIYFYKDSSVAFWSEEDAYIGQNYPSFAQAIENLFVAAANSEHAERFENEYFGAGLIEEYRDGGDLTDELIALLEEEAELENKYNSLSTANVYITYGSMYDTVDNILAHYRDLNGEDSGIYNTVSKICMELYYFAAQDAMVPIYVDLVKVRRLIADELGAESYAEYAYEQRYHDYSPSVATDFLNDIATHIVPLYSQLAYSLGPVLDIPPEDMYVEPSAVLNELYEVYGGMDTELSDIYNYMLQHKLYDVDLKSQNRYEGAFTTYIEGNNSPFVFITTKRNIYDYMTVAHEFGHFTDYYVNNGGQTSLDLTEVYSTALEYLTLLEMKEFLPSDTFRFLLYYQLKSSFETLLVQGFYAMFEDCVYKLAYDDITEENLRQIAANTGSKFSLNVSVVSDLSNIMIDHLMLYPFYVQSYCTSLVAALQIFIAEKENEGAGLEIYKALLARPSEELSFEELLEMANIDSPFGDEVLRDVANEIYYIVTGSYYYPKEHDDTNAA